MPSLHPCMFLVLNSVSPHDFNSPSEFLSRCRHVGATPGHIFHTLASDPLFMAIPGILFVFPESTIFIDALMTAHLFHLPKKNTTITPRNQKKPGSRSKTTNPRSLIKITPLAAPQSGLVLQRPSPAVHMVAPPGTVSKRGGYCTSFAFQDLPPVIVLGDLDKIFQRENYVPFHWSYLGRKNLSEGWPESLQNALRKSC